MNVVRGSSCRVRLCAAPGGCVRLAVANTRPSPPRPAKRAAGNYASAIALAVQGQDARRVRAQHGVLHLRDQAEAVQLGQAASGRPLPYTSPYRRTRMPFRRPGAERDHPDAPAEFTASPRRDERCGHSRPTVVAGVNIRQGAHWLAAVCRRALPDDVVDLLDPPCSPVPAEPPIVRLLLGPKLRPQHEKTPGSQSWTGRFPWSEVVVRGRIELPTFRLSGLGTAVYPGP
jgi:hypothetical protein